MVQIVKGRYGYVAEDGTVQIAKAGMLLSLDKREEERLVRVGCAITVEDKDKDPIAKFEAENIPEQKEPTKRPRRRKGRKE